MNRKSVLTIAVLACLAATGWICPVFAETIVGNVFVDGYDGWTAVGTRAGGGTANWGILLTDDKALSESSDGYVGTSATRDGKYKPYIMYNASYSTPSNYSIETTLSSWDDDGLGMVFNYQNELNYFRVGVRYQSTGSLGFPEGISMQKVVGGAITQLQWNNAASYRPMYDNTQFTLAVSVTDTNYTVSYNGTSVFTGSDSDLAGGGSYGALSWYEKAYSGTQLQRGMLVHSISVASDTLNKSHVFANALPTAWRPLTMYNSNGVTGADGEDRGNFRINFLDGTIVDDTNGYEWATTTTPNVDFIGPAVVVDEPGNETWSDYQMKVRMGTGGDDDGVGLLVRVAGDKTFYRINFDNQLIGSDQTRAPRGMSIQKCLNGVWTELYRDDQDNPLFDYTPGQLFDVQVDVVGNTIDVLVTAGGTDYHYPLVTDSSSPILAGSVGFTNWGCGDFDSATGVPIGVVYTSYGGDSQNPLLVVIPEPSSWLLLGGAALLLLLARRRRR
jgi:hypothetical protein